MNLVQRLKAGKYIRELKDPGHAPDAVAALEDRLAGMGPGVLDRLFDSLSHGSARKPVLEVLGRLLTDETLPAYLEALGSRNPATVSGVARLLETGRGYDPVRLLDLLADGTLSKATLESILTARLRDLSPRALVDLLPELGSEARGVIFRLLEKGADSTALPDMIRLLEHPDWWIRLYMVRLLSRFDDPRVSRALPASLADRHKSVRLETVKALHALAAREAIPSLVRCLGDPDLKVQTAAIDAVSELGDATSVPHLLDVLKDEDEYVRRAAVEVLNVVATPEAVQDLVRALRDEDWWVRVRAADALGTLGGDTVVEAVLGLLGSDDEFVRRYAVEILNAIPSEKAVEPLIRALEDGDWWVRERSIDALAKTGDARAVEPLISLMERDPAVAALCARALGEIGDVRAADALERASGHDSEEIRREALGALRKVAPGRNPGRSGSPADPASARARDGASGEGAPFRVEPKRPYGPESGRREEPVRPRPAEPARASGGAPAPVIVNLRDLPPGTVLLRRYKVVERVGKGGFGAIYLVEDSVVEERIILKILNPHLSEDEAAIRRFTQELRLTRRITHKNVIRIFDFLELEGGHGVSMEFFPGRDLGKILAADGALEPARALRIVAQVCEGLSAAHRAGVVHRDIKPGNILVGDDDIVKIVDFGLASVEHQLGSRLTKSGLLIGTPEYMAPEQIRGEEVDHRADIYAVGVVLYEMLSGRTPFVGDTPVKILFQHLEGEIAPLRDLCGVSPETEALVDAAMARDPGNRPPDAEALRRRIEDVLALPGMAA